MAEIECFGSGMEFWDVGCVRISFAINSNLFPDHSSSKSNKFYQDGEGGREESVRQLVTGAVMIMECGMQARDLRIKVSAHTLLKLCDRLER